MKVCNLLIVCLQIEVAANHHPFIHSSGKLLFVCIGEKFGPFPDSIAKKGYFNGIEKTLEKLV